MNTRKRIGPEAAFNANRSVKKWKQEMESSSTGKGSKSKPCTKFFRTVVPQMVKLGPSSQASMYVASPPPTPDGSSRPALKTRLCNHPEGCKFGDKCHFAHNTTELGQPFSLTFDNPCDMASGRFAGAYRLPNTRPPLSCYDPHTTKIPVYASLAEAIIRNGGVNLNKICQQTGAKLFIRKHESDRNLKNIELEGMLAQLKIASAMVIELIVWFNSKPHQPLDI